MLKILLTLISAFGILHAAAQLSVDVKTIDLSKNGKSKSARLVDSKKDPVTGQMTLTFSSTLCDADETSTSYTMKGLIYNFEHLTFDKDLNFVKKEDQQVEGLWNALKSAPVLGRNYKLDTDNRYTLAQGPSGKGGSSLVKLEYGIEVVGRVDKANRGFCNEILKLHKVDTYPLTAEGTIYAHSVPGGMRVITQDGKPDTKIMARYFDVNGHIKAESSFNVPYVFAMHFTTFATEAGGEDILIIVQPTEKVKNKWVTLTDVKADPTEFEFIRLDGKSMQVKDRFTFKSNHTNWLAEHVYEKDGALYVMGQLSKDKKYAPYNYGPFVHIEGSFKNYVSTQTLENFQIMKVVNGKPVYVSLITPAMMKKVNTAIKGAKGSGDPSAFFRLQEIKTAGNRLLISGQKTALGKTNDDRQQEFIMFIDEKGQLETLFYVPKQNYANSNMFFSADHKKLYWAIYDYSEYEISATKLLPVTIYGGGLIQGGSDHTFLGKRNDDDGPQLQLVEFDLEKNKASELQLIGKDQFTLYDDFPVLYADQQEVVFLGVSGKSKARVSHLIKLKL